MYGKTASATARGTAPVDAEGQLIFEELIPLNAYDGLRVLDLTTGTAGPLAGTFFSDFGADVLKIESPAGDPGRGSASFVAWNRGKRGATADPADMSDRQRIAELAAQADLVMVRQVKDLENWGINVGDLLVAPSAPVVLEFPTWAGAAPWYGGHESQALVAAASGYSRRQSSYSGDPVDIVYPHLLYIQAVMGATSATAALVERLRSGRGQIVTVDSLHAVAEAFTGNYTLDPDLPVPNSAVGPGGSNPTYRHYQGSDGRWFLVAGLTPKFQERILKAIGEEWIIDDPRVNGDFASIYGDANRQWVYEVIREKMSTRPSTEWLELMRAASVPCAGLNVPAEAFAHPQAHEMQMRQEVQDDERGTLTIVGQPVRAERTPAAFGPGAPTRGQPLAGTDWLPTATAASTVGGWKGATGGTNDQGPLAGLRVILAGSFVAGPFGAFLLGNLGADVIKVEQPGGDPWRDRGFYYSDGMRSIMLDLKSTEGRDTFLRLASTADVMVDNLRPGVLQNLKIGYDDLVAVNPDIVTASLTGFGQAGPLAQQPGFDPVLQAWSGMCVAQGGDDTPVLYTVPICDVMGAALLAFGATLGLFHRLRTGEGQRLSTSLAAASLFLQCGQLMEGTDDVQPPVGGRDYPGPSDLDRYYRVSDGWVRIQARAGTTYRDVLAALGAPGTATLEDVLAALPESEVLSRLFQGKVPAAPARLARDFVLSGDYADRFQERRPTSDYLYYRPQRYMQFSRTSYDQDMRPPGGGEHSKELLLELGVSEDEITGLVSKKAVLLGEPMVARVLNPYR